MPVGPLKNMLYGLALPVLGKRCEWQTAGDEQLTRILKKHHAVGACVQCFRSGSLTECYAAGYASLKNGKQLVTPETVFRTASVAKMVTALLVFRLQTLGKLNVQQDVSELMGYPVRNPSFPDAPITLAMLLSHTSSLVDSPAYFDSFQHPVPLRTLLTDAQSYMPAVPGTAFRYSNFAAGMIGCLLEKVTGKSFEALAQQELFAPLGVKATFDASTLDASKAADSYRVLPERLAFVADKRIAEARAITEPDPEHHYLLASGNLYLTASDLAKLTLTAWNGSDCFLDSISLQEMQKPLLSWPQKDVPMKHGMGLLQLQDARICSRPLWGHQGFAYGAVNGVFFDAQGNGFAALNSGASEQRMGHLANINLDLIAWAMEAQRSDS